MPENKIAKKSKGRVYTPEYIVNNILDMAHYIGDNIIEKHVIDNSCGDGAFLCLIISRYCKTALEKGISKKSLKEHLEKYIHGIEIEPIEHRKCLENLNSIIKQYGITTEIKWDILCADTLKVDKYNGKMDYVLGNPPYVRVHNLDDSFDMAKKFSFAQDGMTDLYIVFYEIGIKMLNKNGILGYITPSSFFNSLAGNYMRKYFVRENLIEKLVDLKHFQAFNATTYTTIVILNKQHNSRELEYYQFDERNLIPYYVETLVPDDYYISENFYFSTKRNLDFLKKIFFNLGHCEPKEFNMFKELTRYNNIITFVFNSYPIVNI
jgi:adenine-specific DNA-methyltransferase